MATVVRSAAAGRVAVVTGGATGIGFACAKKLGLAGLSVILADINLSAAAASAEKLRAQGVQAVGISCDVKLRQSVEAMVKETVQTFGSLDVMVANAGGLVLACECRSPRRGCLPEPGSSSPTHSVLA